MKSRQVVAEIGIGLISGYVGTRVMEPVTTLLYEWESEEDRKREDAVRPGPPYEIAARKVARLIGIQLNDEQIKKAGMFFHYGIGVSWGPVYTLLRKSTDLHPLPAWLLAGISMWAIVDEGLTPALGLSAPNSAYPLATHIRGFVGHLAYGLGVATSAEALHWLGRNADTD